MPINEAKMFCLQLRADIQINVPEKCYKNDYRLQTSSFFKRKIIERK